MADRPHVLMITAHDVGRHLGCYGIPQAGTPRLDSLADDGIRLARFHSTAPQCSPARSSIVTGGYPHSTGVLGICSPVFGFDLNLSEKPLVCHLKETGYRTGRIGAVHETLHPEALPYDLQGPRGSGTEIAEHAVAFLSGHETTDRPFFLQIGPHEAHRPFTYPPFVDDGIHVPGWLGDDDMAREELGRFQGSLHALDEAVGTILDGLDTLGLAQNTLVLFMADHGIPFPRAKHSLYEPGCQAAAILRWPARGWSGGRVLDGMVSGVDIFPTLMEALGLAIPDNVQGQSFVGTLDGGSDVGREAIFTEQNYNAWTDVSRAVRTERHKLIANFTPGRGFSDSSQTWRPQTQVVFLENAARTYHPPFELYDLAEDPMEENNLAQDRAHAAVLKDLQSRLLSWMRETRDPLLTGIPEPPLYGWTMEALTEASTD